MPLLFAKIALLFFSCIVCGLFAYYRFIILLVPCVNIVPRVDFYAV